MDASLLRLLWPSSLVGVVLGAMLLAALPEAWLARTVAAVALVFALAQLGLRGAGSCRLAAPPSRAAGVGAGLLMGIASMVAHSGGLAASLTGRIVLAAVLVIPLLGLGAWLGFRVGGRLPRRAFEVALLSIAVVGAVRLLLR